MAEENTINQLKSEKNKPEDVDEKANPNDRLTITKVPRKIHSRYLSSPKGSCHDLCKFGIQHATEPKPWSQAKKRITKKESKTKVPDENLTSLERAKKSGSGSKSFQTSKLEKSNSPVDIKEVTREKIATSEKKSPMLEETDVSLEHNISDIKQAHSEPPPLQVQECSRSQTKKKTIKSKSPSGSSSRKETESRSKQTRTSSIGGKEKSTSPSPPLSSKHHVKKPSSISSKSAKSLKKVPSQKNHENVEELKPEIASRDNSQDKIVHVTEPASSNSSEETTPACDATKLSSPSPSSSEDKSLNQISKQTVKSGVSASSRKGLRSIAGNKGKINTPSVLKSQSMSSSVSSSNKSNKRGHGHQGENQKVVYKIRPKVSTIVGAANKVITARKLSFRRGKVTDVQPQSNNIPRRLKFKPVRILGDDIQRDTMSTRRRNITGSKVCGGDVNDANIKSEKVVAKLQTVERNKRRVVGRKVCGERSKIESSKSGSEKVVLRHQNVEGKKHNPRLYNNVIEETASMLAELRKSKVKALVGAFETVISLDSPREASSAEVSTAC